MAGLYGDEDAGNVAPTGGGIPPNRLADIEGPLLNLIQQDMGTITKNRAAGGLSQFFGGNTASQNAAANIQKNLGLVKELRAQETARLSEVNKRQDQARQFAQFALDKADKFHELDPDTQEKTRGFMVQTIGDVAKRLGIQIDPAHIVRAFEAKDYGRLAYGFFGDPFVTPDEKQQTESQLRLAKGTPAALQILKDAEKMVTDRASLIVRGQLPHLAAMLGASAQGNQVPAAQAQAAILKAMPNLGQSQILQRAWADLQKNDPEAFSAVGLIPGQATLAGQKKAAEAKGEGPRVDVFTSTALAEMGLTPSTANPAQVAEAEKKAQARRVETSAAQGSLGVKEKAVAEAGLPLIQSMPDRHIVDKSTGQFVDRTGTKLSDITSGGGEKKYAVLDKDETKAYRGILEAKVLLDRYADISSKLAQQPGANQMQRLDALAKTALGIPNIGVDLDSMRGSVLRLAGTFQGSRVQLSDNDVKAVAGMIPTTADTAGTAAQRLTNVRAILEAMQKVALGESSNASLHDLIQKGAGKSPGDKTADFTWDPKQQRIVPKKK